VGDWAATVGRRVARNEQPTSGFSIRTARVLGRQGKADCRGLRVRGTTYVTYVVTYYAAVA